MTTIQIHACYMLYDPTYKILGYNAATSQMFLVLSNLPDYLEIHDDVTPFLGYLSRVICYNEKLGIHAIFD